MEQNTVLTDNMERKLTVGKFEQPAEISLFRTDGQRSLLPEVSNLITSVNQLTSHNFELLKMAKVPGNDIGTGHEIDLSKLQVEITFLTDHCKKLNLP